SNDDSGTSTSLTVRRCRPCATYPAVISWIILVFWGLYISGVAEAVIRWLVLILTLLYAAGLVAVVSCGNYIPASAPNWKGGIGGYCYDAVVLMLHSILEMTETSNEFPQLTYLTDGGHVDNTW